jgi:hypothetical protein
LGPAQGERRLEVKTIDYDRNPRVRGLWFFGIRIYNGAGHAGRTTPVGLGQRYRHDLG